MSVFVETSLGNIVIDLEVDACPKICCNFLKLCKIYYYNLNAFFNVSRNFVAQIGDPTATGSGGESIHRIIDSNAPCYFVPELVPQLKHVKRGTVSMVVAPNAGGAASQFYITLADNIEYLDGNYAVFGHVVEGFDTLDKLNQVFTDQDGRPLKDARIRHVDILDDPFPDPEGLQVPEAVPTEIPDNRDLVRIGEEEDPLQELPEEQAERKRRKTAATASALILEMIGDLPFAHVRPPESVLFVCNLNRITTDENLRYIFLSCGEIMSCQIIRDKKTGASLQYAFVEFDKRKDAEQAYFRLQGVLLDDRRLRVDFSQSVPRFNTYRSRNDVRISRNHCKKNIFAGREDLEATRRYRADQDNGTKPRVHDLVLDDRDLQRRHGDHGSRRPCYQRSHSRSPRQRNRRKNRR